MRSEVHSRQCLNLQRLKSTILEHIGRLTRSKHSRHFLINALHFDKFQLKKIAPLRHCSVTARFRTHLYHLNSTPMQTTSGTRKANKMKKNTNLLSVDDVVDASAPMMIYELLREQLNSKDAIIN